MRLATLVAFLAMASAAVVVDTMEENPTGADVVKSHKYESQVTLYIEGADGELTPSGWSTRKEEGGNGKPFAFQPGKGLIAGWTEGVLQMKEGERAKIHVPADLGYGSKAMGSPGSAWYIPANSNLLFDIQILGKEGHSDL